MIIFQSTELKGSKKIKSSTELEGFKKIKSPSQMHIEESIAISKHFDDTSAFKSEIATHASFTLLYKIDNNGLYVYLKYTAIVTKFNVSDFVSDTINKLLKDNSSVSKVFINAELFYFTNLSIDKDLYVISAGSVTLGKIIAKSLTILWGNNLFFHGDIKCDDGIIVIVSKTMKVKSDVSFSFDYFKSPTKIILDGFVLGNFKINLPGQILDLVISNSKFTFLTLECKSCSLKGYIGAVSKFDLTGVENKKVTVDFKNCSLACNGVPEDIIFYTTDGNEFKISTEGQKLKNDYFLVTTKEEDKNLNTKEDGQWLKKFVYTLLLALVIVAAYWFLYKEDESVVVYNEDENVVPDR
jgi:hypothetical protein